jgi:hypothetical protein
MNLGVENKYISYLVKLIFRLVNFIQGSLPFGDALRSEIRW